MLLQGLAVVDVCWLIEQGIESVQRRDGIPAHPRLRQLRLVFAEVTAAVREDVVSHRRHDDVANPGERAELEPVRRLTSGEAAKTLGITVRSVQRIAATELDGVRVGRSWLFEESVVLAFAARRNSNQDRSAS